MAAMAAAYAYAVYFKLNITMWFAYKFTKFDVGAIPSYNLYTLHFSSKRVKSK